MKRLFVTLMALMALMVAAPAAHATDWFDVLSSGGETIAVNPEISTTDNGKSYLVWVRNSFDVPESRAIYSRERGYDKTVAYKLTLYKFTEATDATDKVDALRCTRIVNVKERLQHKLLEESHIKAIDRAQILEELVLERASIPLAAHVEVHLVLLSRALHLVEFSNVEHLLQFFHELFRSTAVQILEHAVVIKNLELSAREEDSEITVVFFVARVLRVLFSAVAGSASTSGTAVVTVSNVAHRNFFEGLADSFDFGIVVDDPNGMAKAVALAHEVVNRLALGHCTEDIELAVVAVSEEHRTRIGVRSEHMAQTVFFLVSAGKFVLLDGAVEVVGSRNAAHKTVLFATVHRLAINVEARLLVESDHAVFDHLVEIFTSVGINLRIVSIDRIRKFEFGTRHAQVGVRKALSHSLGFGAIHHVVRERRDSLSFSRVHRTQSLERIDVHHRFLSFVCFFD